MTKPTTSPVKRRNEFAMAFAVGKYPHKVMTSKHQKLKCGYIKHKGKLM
jgi:hypothetical protein